MTEETRTVRETVGAGELPTFGRVREVVAEYGDGKVRREIEVVENGRYVPKFTEMDDAE